MPELAIPVLTYALAALAFPLAVLAPCAATLLAPVLVALSTGGVIAAATRSVAFLAALAADAAVMVAAAGLALRHSHSKMPSRPAAAGLLCIAHVFFGTLAALSAAGAAAGVCPGVAACGGHFMVAAFLAALSAVTCARAHGAMSDSAAAIAETILLALAGAGISFPARLVASPPQHTIAGLLLLVCALLACASRQRYTRVALSVGGVFLAFAHTQPARGQLLVHRVAGVSLLFSLFPSKHAHVATAVAGLVFACGSLPLDETSGAELAVACAAVCGVAVSGACDVVCGKWVQQHDSDDGDDCDGCGAGKE